MSPAIEASNPNLQPRAAAGAAGSAALPQAVGPPVALGPPAAPVTPELSDHEQYAGGQANVFAGGSIMNLGAISSSNKTPPSESLIPFTATISGSSYD